MKAFFIFTLSSVALLSAGIVYSGYSSPRYNQDVIKRANHYNDRYNKDIIKTAIYTELGSSRAGGNQDKAYSIGQAEAIYRHDLVKEKQDRQKR